MAVGGAEGLEVERGDDSDKAEDESAAVQHSDDGVAQARHFVREREKR